MYLVKLQIQGQQDRLATLKIVQSKYRLVHHGVRQPMEERHQREMFLEKAIWLHSASQIVPQGGNTEAPNSSQQILDLTQTQLISVNLYN